LPSDLLDDLRKQNPDPARVAQIQRALSESSRSVKPLPSDRVLVLLLLAGFLILVVAGAILFGFLGLETFSPLQKVLYYGALLFAGWSLASATVEQIIPAARYRFPFSVQILAPLLVFALITMVVFPDFQTNHFVSQGIPCLRLGLIVALPSAVIVSLVMTRGFVTDRLTAAIAAGAFSGLIGTGVLALHCPIANSAHILTWHMGVIAIAVLAGATIGWVVSRRF
jgi:hypothetical protein